jgi:hypothetical protein
MKQYVMILIFEDGTVDTCRVIDKEAGWMEILPLSENVVVTTDFKVACSTKIELIEEMRVNYRHLEYVTIKNWTGVVEWANVAQSVIDP